MWKEVLVEHLAWPEGPCVMPDASIVFVETYRSQVSRWSARGGYSTYAVVGGGPNAAICDQAGFVYITQNGGVVGPWRAEVAKSPGLQIITPNGKVTDFVDTVDGQRLLAPNDLVFGPDGRIYFTDPGGPFDAVGREQSGRIFVVDREGRGELLVETGRTYPNGIAFDRNGNLIWAESYSREIKKHESGGQLSKIGVLKGDSVPDGIKVTAEGKTLICACGSGLVEIMDDTGALGVALHAGEFPTNCAVSGDFLYVTDGGLPGEGRQAAPLGRLSRLRIPPSY